MILLDRFIIYRFLSNFLVLFGLLVAVAVISILIWWLSNNSDL